MHWFRLVLAAIPVALLVGIAVAPHDTGQLLNAAVVHVTTFASSFHIKFH